LADEKTDTEIESAPPAPTPDERVESWKEIAAYLQRDVRTVQRWEKKESLPVYRHMHDKLGTVYAYRAELDAWWNNRRPRLELEAEKPEDAEPAWPSWQANKGLWVGAVAAAVVAAIAGGLWLSRGPALPFAERDWVLITRFENRTGDSLLDGTLEYALERELSNSRFVNVVPRVRVDDALRLMRKPPGTAVGAALGREVCLRDGGIRAMIAGRVEKLDSTYVLTASLVNPADGSTVASFSEEAEGQKQVLAAIGRLSDHVRAALGEELALIPESGSKLEKATTPSLRALQLYSQGKALIDEPGAARANWGIAGQFFEQALAEDPAFASAHLWLAWAYRNTGRREEARPHFKRAFELADTTIGHEHYFILGCYYWVYLDDPERAAQAFEAGAQLYPDHFWTIHKLTEIYLAEGRFDKILPHRIRLAELRPNNWRANYRAGYILFMIEDDPKRAQRYLERFHALTVGEPADQPAAEPEFAREAAEAHFLPVWRHLFRNEIDEAQRAIEQLAKTGNAQPEPIRVAFAAHLAEAHEGLGQIKRGEEVCQSLADQSARSGCLMWNAWERGDVEAFRAHSQLRPRDVSATFYLAMLGLEPEARAKIAELEKQGVVRGYLEASRALLALHRGRANAPAQLEEALRRVRPFNSGVALYGFATLGRFYEQKGDYSNGIRVLEEANRPVPADRRLFAATNALVHVRAHLAGLYRKVGRGEEAEQIEQRLRERLKYADADHPILRQLQQSQSVAATQSAK